LLATFRDVAFTVRSAVLSAFPTLHRKESSMRLARFASMFGLVAAIVLGGGVTAQASVGPAPGPGGSAAAKFGLNMHAGPAAVAPSGTKHPATSGQTLRANIATNDHWSGYVATGGSYTSVTSSWIVPQTYCTNTGEVGFWVGLDGDPTATVEQTGTAADCSTGTPRYFGWFEMYPEPPVDYTNTVKAGDAMTASVTYSGAQYHLLLTDVTESWQQSQVQSPFSGARNASAEIIAEIPSGSVLPNFGAADFSASRIDGATPQAAGAVPFDMVNGSGSVIVATSGIDTTGDFTISYQEGISGTFESAFENNGGYLSTYNAQGYTPYNQSAQATSSSPVITSVAGGHETAYRASTGDLSVYGTDGAVSTPLGMAAGTSPSITTLTNGNYLVAFQTNTGYLAIYSPLIGGVQIPLGMMAGTSPSIIPFPGGSYMIAYQANTGYLWTYNPAAGGVEIPLGMMAGTNPSMTALPGGNYAIAFQANTGYLWTYTPAGGGAPTGLGMMAGSSPGIAALFNGTLEVVYTANTNEIWTYSPSTGGIDLQVLASEDSSPSITAVPTGYEIAYQYYGTSALCLIGSLGAIDTLVGMPTGTNPALSL
jgi:hypothetical protein